MTTDMATPATGGAVEGQGNDNPGSTAANNNTAQPDIAQILANHKEKLKINGKEKELSYAEMKRLASISDASNDKFNSAKQMAEEAKQIKQAFESGDVVKALKQMGKQPAEIKQLLEDKLLELIEDEQLDPKEREIRELKKFKEQVEKEQKSKAEAESKRKQAEKETKLLEQLQSDMLKAIEGSSMKNTPQLFKRVAQEMESAFLKGYEMSAQEAVKIVEKDLIEEYTALLPTLGVDRVKQALGNDFMKKLQEEQVKAIKESTPVFKKEPPKQDDSIKAKDEQEKIGMSQLFRNMRRGI